MDDVIKINTSNPDKYAKNPGHDFTRERKIGLLKTIKLILTIHGNSINQEVFNYCEKYCEKEEDWFKASAFAQQRSKLRPELFENIFNAFNDSFVDPKTFCGYRLYAVDGSDLNIPYDEKAATFVKHGKEGAKGYNQYHMNVLFDLCNKIYKDCVLQPRPTCNEHEALFTMLGRNLFEGKNIIITDRGYEGYNVLAHFLETKNVDFLCRVKSGEGGMKDITKLPLTELDTDISYKVTKTQTNEDKENGYRYTSNKFDFDSPYPVKIRVVRFMLSTGEYETIVTSLDRKEFPSHVIKYLYHMRWGVETSFRELKYAKGLVNLHSKKDEYIRQEIYAHLIMYNFCERIIGAVVVQQKEENIHIYQVNYTMAIHICRKFYSCQGKYKFSVLDKIAEYILPVRLDRHDERNVKPKTVISFLYRVAA